jgi:hypothetical protein
MNLFRSEEHARNWSGFDPANEEAIMPVRDWAFAFVTPATRSRLESDSVARLLDYRSGLLDNLATLGRSGERWRTREERGE